jgi:hypothetical protein
MSFSQVLENKRFYVFAKIRFGRHFAELLYGSVVGVNTYQHRVLAISRVAALPYWSARPALFVAVESSGLNRWCWLPDVAKVDA